MNETMPDDTDQPRKQNRSNDGVRITLRLVPDEHAAFQAAADRLGLPLGVWLRLIGRKAAGLPSLGE